MYGGDEKTEENIVKIILYYCRLKEILNKRERRNIRHSQKIE